MASVRRCSGGMNQFSPRGAKTQSELSEHVENISRGRRYSVPRRFAQIFALAHLVLRMLAANVSAMQHAATPAAAIDRSPCQSWPLMTAMDPAGQTTCVS